MFRNQLLTPAATQPRVQTNRPNAAKPAQRRDLNPWPQRIINLVAYRAAGLAPSVRSAFPQRAA